MESPILEVEGDRESGLSSDNESDASGSDSEEVLFEFCLLYLLIVIIVESILMCNKLVDHSNG